MQQIEMIFTKVSRPIIADAYPFTDLFGHFHLFLNSKKAIGLVNKGLYK